MEHFYVPFRCFIELAAAAVCSANFGSLLLPFPANLHLV